MLAVISLLIMFPSIRLSIERKFDNMGHLFALNVVKKFETVIHVIFK